MSRAIAVVSRIKRLDEVDEQADRREYWKTRSIEERILEVESLRRLWPELVGNADAPIERVVHRRRLGEPAPSAPTRPRAAE